jgi:protein-disulfide isomerase
MVAGGGCSSAPALGDPTAAAPTAPAKAAPVAASADRSNALGTLGGKPLTLADAPADLLVHYRRQKADNAVKLWRVQRRLARDLAAHEALQLAALAAGKTAPALRAELRKSHSAPPLTADLVQSVYESNKKAFSGQSFDQAKDQIVEQLTAQFSEDVDRQIDRDLIDKLGFKSAHPAPDVERTPMISDSAASKGPPDAAVTVVLFSDFECPYCARQFQINRSLEARYGDQVRWQYRHYPLPFHPFASELAKASICAAAAGKFWAFHDRIFSARGGFADGGIIDHAQAVGINDVKGLVECMKAKATQAQIDVDIKAADAVGLEGTPTMFVNGIPIFSATDPTLLQDLIEAELERLKKTL